MIDFLRQLICEKPNCEECPKVKTLEKSVEYWKAQRELSYKSSKAKETEITELTEVIRQGNKHISELIDYNVGLIDEIAVMEERIEALKKTKGLFYKSIPNCLRIKNADNKDYVYLGQTFWKLYTNFDVTFRPYTNHYNFYTGMTSASMLILMKCGLIDNNTQEIKKGFTAVEVFDKIVKAVQYHIDYVSDQTLYFFVDNTEGSTITIAFQKGDCLHEDTLIYKTNGELVKIKDINENDEILGKEGKKALVINKWDKGQKEIIEFELDNKTTIKATEEHRFFVEENGMIIEKLGKELNVGDILTKTNYNFSKEKKIDLTDEELTILGLAVADGWLKYNNLNKQPSQVGIAGKDGFKKETQKHFIREFCEKNNYNYNWSWKQITISGKEFKSTKLWEYITKIGRGAKNKQIPLNILDLTKSQAEALLKGLQADASYRVKSRVWIYRTISQKLSSQLFILLGMLGKNPNKVLRTNHQGLGLNPIYDISERLTEHLDTKIIKITKKGEKARVYDIETTNKGITLPEHNCYVHNCESSAGVVIDAFNVYEYLTEPFEDYSVFVELGYFRWGSTSGGHGYAVLIDHSVTKETVLDKIRVGEATAKVGPSRTLRDLKDNNIYYGAEWGLWGTMNENNLFGGYTISEEYKWYDEKTNNYKK